MKQIGRLEWKVSDKWVWLLFGFTLHFNDKFNVSNPPLIFIRSCRFLLKMQGCWAVSPMSKFSWIFQRPTDVSGTCKENINTARRHPNRPHVQEAFVYKKRFPAAEEKDSSFMCLDTMVSARTLLLAVTCCYAYLWLVRAEDSSLETRSLDFTLKTQQEKDLVRTCVGNMGWICVIWPKEGFWLFSVIIVFKLFEKQIYYKHLLQTNIEISF